MSYPRYKLARSHKFATRTSGDVSITTTSYMDVDTGIDIVLAAQVDDVIEVGATLRWAASTVYSFMDVATIVSATPVNYLSGAGSSGEGIPSWFGDGGASGMNLWAGGGTRYKIVTGDLSSGYVTLRLRAKVNTSSRLLKANSTVPFRWWADNIGPQDQN